MMKRAVSTLLFLAAVLGSTNVRAADAWLLGINYDLGGDEILEVTFVNATTNAFLENRSLRANEGFHLYGGYLFHPLADDSPWSTSLTLGLHYQELHGQNASASFTSFPVEAIQHYQLGNWRVGAGLVLHLFPRLKGTEELAEVSQKWKPALGGVWQVDYHPNGGEYAVGVRYTAITYRPQKLVDANGYVYENASGTTVGLVFTMEFQ